MISVTEVNQIANSKQVEPSVIERDYVNGWFLCGMFNRQQFRNTFVFKGGTALRKLYFPNYRFSEDLDFTLKESVSSESLQENFVKVCEELTEETGIEFSLVRFSKVRDVPKEEAYDVRVEYIGPRQHRRGNLPRIRLDLTVYEKIILEPSFLPLFHPYSDKDSVEAVIPVYQLEEIIAEKLRAFSSRIRPRDLYDLWYLLKEKRDKVDISTLNDTFLAKCEYKSVEPNLSNLFSASRMDALKKAWSASLSRQLRFLPEFSKVLDELTCIVSAFWESFS